MDYIVSDLLRNYPQIISFKKFLIGHPGFIAGGCFRSAFCGETPKDLDMFFKDVKEYTEAIRYFETSVKDYERGYQNHNVKSFIHKSSGIRIECVKKVFGSPEKILSNFDFTITKFALYTEAEPPEPDEEDDSWHYTDFVMYHPSFFEHLVMKRLVADDKLIYPISSFNRSYKYAKYGFFPCRETKLKMIHELQALSKVDDADLGKSFYEGVD